MCKGSVEEYQMVDILGFDGNRGESVNRSNNGNQLYRIFGSLGRQRNSKMYRRHFGDTHIFIIVVMSLYTEKKTIRYKVDKLNDRGADVLDSPVPLYKIRRFTRFQDVTFELFVLRLRLCP